jgi:hypothetical protein
MKKKNMALLLMGKHCSFCITTKKISQITEIKNNFQSEFTKKANQKIE